MASFVPAKSKPLHNFELPPLIKWSKEGEASAKRRRSMKSPPASVSPPRCSPPPQISSEGDLDAIECQLKNCSWNSEEEKEMAENDDIEEGEIVESNKSWNLRPRNAKKEAKIVVEGGKKENCDKKKKAAPLSIRIALTKEEIEEDIFALTGAKASRRPKRRPKNVQKQLDAAFPGLWLLAITPESYKVSENSLKQG